MRVKMDWEQAGVDSKGAKAAIPGALIAAAARGELDARQALVQRFLPVLTAFAKKRTEQARDRNQLVDAGSRGLMRAATRYRGRAARQDFRLFALPFIEKGMDIAQGKAGWWTRLFWR